VYSLELHWRSVTVKILYFARTRELAGTSEEELEIPASGVLLSELMRTVGDRHPALAPVLTRVRVARNESFAELSERTLDGDVIALIPPVAGG
jgi:molybdopterin converting factor subunit 1